MALMTHDLKLLLDTLAQNGERQYSSSDTALPFDLFHLLPGQNVALYAIGPAMLVILSGHGSIDLNDWRTTLSGGQTLSIPADSTLALEADGDLEWRLLLVKAPK